MSKHFRFNSTILSFSAVVVLTLAGRGAASADSFTTVNMAPFINGSPFINGYTFPVGTTNGNQGINIPFDIASNGGIAGAWLGAAGAGTSLTVPLNVSGQASFYALLNNYFGTPGADEYDIAISATNGDSVTYQSIGGVNTRDFNESHWSNTIAATTTEWFDNGIGQRLDVREFTLPTSFANETISSFKITQINSHDTALFSGLTFSSAPAEPLTPTPEPFSFALTLAGAAAVLGCSRLHKKKVSD